MCGTRFGGVLVYIPTGLKLLATAWSRQHERTWLLLDQAQITQLLKPLTLTPKAKTTMPVYQFTGTITQEHNFYIDAYTLEEAISRAKNGDYNWQDLGSNIKIVQIDLSSLNLSPVQEGSLEHD